MIELNELRVFWEKEGVFGDWRELLKRGYQKDELYFEFGLMPDTQSNCDFKIILDHEIPVFLCPEGVEKKGEHVIKLDEEKRGKVEVELKDNPPRFKFKTYFIGSEEYLLIKKEAEKIFNLYGDDEIICFWSIPNKWFEDTLLVKFLREKIVESEDYDQYRSGKTAWYWP